MSKTNKAAENPNVVILGVPVKRGDTEIKSLTLIKPNAGTLRGVGLADVANAEVDALIKVLPRMTYPALTESEVIALELPDLLTLAGKVVGFLSPNAER
ncbi:Tail protein [Serratia fonticola AU-P3(3)]|nr:Tail protein [Serratia fonticola AU-P3(3)]